MHVCILHVYKYIHTHTNTYIYIYIYTYIRTYIHTYVRTYINVYTHMYICNHIYIKMVPCRHVDSPPTHPPMVWSPSLGANLGPADLW